MLDGFGIIQYYPTIILPVAVPELLDELRGFFGF